jgi:type IV secretory pathway VirB10-like protein
VAQVKPAATPAPPQAETYWLRRGMTIAATLYNSVDSTVPGLLIAYVGDDPIYDFTHAVIVIPPHAKLIGSFGGNGASIAQGVSRIAASFDQVQLGDRVIDLGTQPGGDRTGTSGLGATVDRHTRGALANFLIVTAAGVLLNRDNAQTCSGINCAQTSSIGSSVGGSVVSAGQQMLNHLQEQPSLHIKEGSQIW